MNKRCTCEAVTVQRLNGECEIVPGIIATDCPIHYVAGRLDRYANEIGGYGPMRRYARNVTDYHYRVLRNRDGKVTFSYLQQVHRRETSAEVQRRLHAEALT